MRTIVSLLLSTAVFALAACAWKGQPTRETAQETPTPALTPTPTPAPTPIATPIPTPTPRPTDVPGEGNPVVVMKTSMGLIEIELNPERAPITVKNFLSYVDEGHYDGTIFHRVIGSFMVQGGGFTADLKEKATKPPIKLEAANGLSNIRGTIAMARTGVPDSATSQFFINVVDNSRGLNPSPGKPGYAVFGKVISGMDTVDKIRVVATTTKRFANGQMMQNVPINTVTIESVTRRK